MAHTKFVVPCAAAGSLMFTPDICLPALRAMKRDFGSRIYKRYGFVDGFHPNTGWQAEDVIGIDVGITLLSSENLRTGNVWKWFAANPEAPREARARYKFEYHRDQISRLGRTKSNAETYSVMTYRRNRVDGWKVTSEKSTVWVVKSASNKVTA